MRRFVSLVAASLFFAAPAFAGDVAGAKAFVDNVAKQALTIVQSKDSKEVQKNKLLDVVDANVDIDFVAKFVLGKHWRTATEAQRQAYLEAYRPFLKTSYVSRLTRYTGQTYTLGTARGEEGSYVVPMTLNDPNGQNVSMIYRVVDAGKDYRISDIVVEGVSLLSTQRSEFNSIASSKGIDYLIDALKKKAANAK